MERKSVEFPRWRTVGTIPRGRPLEFIAERLLSNEIYAFRVTAVNVVGAGKPSKTIDVEVPSEEEMDEEDVDSSFSMRLNGSLFF